MSIPRSVSVQLELPASAPELDSYRDVSDLQILRATHRPLVSSSMKAEPLTELVSGDRAGEYVLERRTSARWADGVPMTPAELRAGLAAGSERFASYARLAGLELSGRPDEPSLRGALEPAVLLRFLAQPAFSPRRSSVPGPARSGRFERLRGSVSTFVDVISNRRLDFRIESRAEDALRAFDRGDLDVTCPSCFELAEVAGMHPNFVRSDCDVQATLVFNPRTTGWFSSVEGRAALGRLLCRSALRQYLCIEEVLEELPCVLPSTSRKGSIELLFADFWPNRQLMKLLAGALAELGAPQHRLRTVPLLDLGPELGKQRFDIALLIFPGMFGVKLSGWARLAAAGVALYPEHRSVLARAFARVSTDGAACGAVEDLLASAPLLPLGHFVAGYLTRDRARLRCLDEECTVNLEEL